MPAKVTAQQIRDLYPDPMTVNDLDTNTPSKSEYCVGGACILYLKKDMNYFPDCYDLAKILMELNPDLYQDFATMLADQIILDNDDYDFNDAWLTLNKALTFTKEN
jgi:hypothetical protein